MTIHAGGIGYGHMSRLPAGNLGLPADLIAPVISGNPQNGETLTLDYVGAWIGSPTSYARQWYADGAAISSASGTTLVLTSAEIGKIITIGIIATSALGSSGEVFSNALGPVIATGITPVNSSLPTVSGTTRQGYTLSVSDGVWDNAPTSFAYQWRRGGADIPGATNADYPLVAGDVGASITCAVTASNSAGSSAPAVSGAIATISAAQAPANTALPVISGTLNIGDVLSVSNGSWSGDPFPAFAYQWKLNGSPIPSAILPAYTLQPADNAGTISCDVTGTNVASSATATATGVGPIGTAAPTLDTSIPAPILSLAVPLSTYPPQINSTAPAALKAGTHSLELEGDNDIAFGSPFLDDTLTISDAQAAAGIRIDSSLLSVLTGINSFRARWRWTTSSLPYCSAWSNTLSHGDTTSVSITSSTTASSAELAPLALTVTASKPCYFTLGGADGGKLQKVGTEPASSIVLQLLGNANLDKENQGSYSFTVTGDDTSGNSTGPVLHALTVNDVDELANSFSFTDVTGATVNTDYTSNTLTVAGLATGYAAPYSISGGLISKNGGAFSSSAGSVVNGDTLAAKVTSSAGSGVVSAVLVIGDVPANQVSDTYSVTVSLSPVDVFPSAGDSNNGPAFSAFSEAPASYIANDNANASNIYDKRLSGAIIPLIAPASATVTMTIAAPCVVTHAGHGLSVGAPWVGSTTGGFPTGVTAGNELYVIPIDANTYKLATTYANALAGTAITSSGSQSGTHTATVNCGLQHQVDIYSQSNTANLGRNSCGGHFEWVKQKRIDSASGRIDFIDLTKGSSRFSDASTLGGRATNWDPSLPDGAYNDLKVKIAAYAALLAAAGKSPNYVGFGISGPANGFISTTESNAFQTFLTALVAAIRADIIGNSVPIIIYRLGTTSNQPGTASFAANVATIRAAQAAVVAAEVAAGRPAYLVNADGGVVSDNSLHWSLGTHIALNRAAYCEVNGLWFPEKMTEANALTHSIEPGDIRGAPLSTFSGTALITALDTVGGLVLTQGTPNNRPTLVSAALSNGYPTCRGASFDGTNDILLATNGAAINPTADFGMCAVISGAATANKIFFCMGGSAGTSQVFYFGTKGDGSGNLVAAWRDDSGATQTLDSGLVAFDGNPHFIACWKSGSTWQFQVDGTLSSTISSTPGTSTLNRTSLGAGNSGGGTPSAHMVCTIRYLKTMGVPNSTYRANQRAYAERHWGAP